MVRDVYINFNKIDKVAHLFINEELKDTELSRGLFFYILELSHRDGIRLKELSRSIFVDKAYTTRAITKLIRLGYVVKKKDDLDHRATKIFLTEKGQQSAKMINKIFERWGELISEGINEQETEQLFDISKRLYENAFKYYCKNENSENDL